MKNSNCSLGVKVDIYWRNCDSYEENTHIEEITDALFDALCQKNSRVWNQWSKAMVRGEIRDRLGAASRGELVPVDHVKALRGGRGSLFEIRWQDIDITDLVEGKPIYGRTNLRLIHAEPFSRGVVMLGLGAVEKPRGDLGAALHEKAIGEAEVYYNGRYDENWGVVFRR